MIRLMRTNEHVVAEELVVEKLEHHAVHTEISSLLSIIMSVTKSVDCEQCWCCYTYSSVRLSHNPKVVSEVTV